MSRPRLISDANVFHAVRGLLAQGGPRAVSFASVAARSGLSAPSLVQRYASRDAMVQAALLDGWDILERRTEAALLACAQSPKGALALLKAFSGEDIAHPVSDIRVLSGELSDPVLRQRAALWHNHMVGALASRLAGGTKGSKAAARDAAEMLFAAWQGRLHWSATAQTGFRLKDLVARLSVVANA